MPPPFHYEIHFHRADGTLAVLLRVRAADDADARRQARDMLRAGLSTAHIWRGGTMMGSEYAGD